MSNSQVYRVIRFLTYLFFVWALASILINSNKPLFTIENNPFSVVMAILSIACAIGAVVLHAIANPKKDHILTGLNFLFVIFGLLACIPIR